MWEVTMGSRSALNAGTRAHVLTLRSWTGQQCYKRRRVMPPTSASSNPQHDVAPPSMSFLQPQPGRLVTEKPSWESAPAAATRTDHDIVLAINNVETLGDLYNLLTRNSGRCVPENYCSVLVRLVELMRPNDSQRVPFPQQGARAADANRVLAAMMPDLQRQLPYFETDQLSFLLGLLPDLPATVDKDLVAAVCRVTCKCFCESARLSSCPSTSLATVTWSLAMLRYWNEFTWQQLAYAISRKLPSFTAPELAHTACAFAMAQRYQPQLFAAIAEQAMARLYIPSEREVPGPVPMGGVPAGMVSGGQAGNAPTSSDNSAGDVFSSSDLAMLMWSFASVRHYDAALLTSMSRQICIRLEGNSPMQGRDLLAEVLNAKFWLKYPSCLPLSNLNPSEREDETTDPNQPANIFTTDIMTAGSLTPETAPVDFTAPLTNVPAATSSTAQPDFNASTPISSNGSERPNAGGMGAKLKLNIQQLSAAARAADLGPGSISKLVGAASPTAGASSSPTGPGASIAGDLAARTGANWKEGSTEDVERVQSGQECSTSSSGATHDFNAFKPVEVAQLAWSYAQLKYHDKPLLGLLAQAIIARTPQYSEKDLYDILMAYTWINHHDPTLTKTLCAALAPELHLLPLANLTALMFALARAHKHRPWEVYEPSFWEAAAQLLPARVPDMKFGEMAKVVWAFAALRHHDPLVMDAVANQVPLKCNASQPGGLTMMVQAYATLNCYNPIVFGAVVQVALRRLPDFNCFQLGAMAGAVALVDWQDMAIFQGIYKRLQNLDAAMFDDDPDALRQLFQADLILRLLHPTTTGRPPLPPQFVQKPQRRSQLRSSPQRKVPRLTAELYRAMLRKGIRPTLGTPSEDKLTSVDLSFKWKGKHDVALQAGIPSCYTLSTPHLPLGAVRAGQLLLQARGWKVVTVPFFEWEAAEQDLSAQDQLLDRYLSALG